MCIKLSYLFYFFVVAESQTYEITYIYLYLEDVRSLDSMCLGLMAARVLTWQQVTLFQQINKILLEWKLEMLESDPAFCSWRDWVIERWWVAQSHMAK